MTTCHYCLGENQDGATICKYCGHEVDAAVMAIAAEAPAKATRTATGTLLVTLLAAILIVVVVAREFACGPVTRDDGSAGSSNATSVSAHDLFVAYQVNQVDADRLYKARVLEVSGTINGINNDMSGQPYLILAVGDRFRGVHATFPRTTNPVVLSTLQQGRTVILQCRGRGMITGDPVLGDCSLQ